MKIYKQALSYDDVLMVPQYSEVISRHNIDLESAYLSLPIIAAPMTTIINPEVARILDKNGASSILHRYCTIEKQVKAFEDSSITNLFCAIGVVDDYLERTERLYEAGCGHFCIDIAHGHHILMQKALETLRNKYGQNIHIMAGNIATPSAAFDLAKWGADSIRVGIAGGKVCTTKFVTGHSVPTFQSLLDITSYDFKGHYPKVSLIADGGIKSSGDIVKSLAAGADCVMLGNLLAGHAESPGDIISINGKNFKEFSGMASAKQQKEWRNRVSVAEGIATLVPFKGNLQDTLDELTAGIKSGLSYSGANNLKELRENAEFIRVSPLSMNYQLGQQVI